MRQIICEAIRNHGCLELIYDGYRRVVEPHAYGVSKDGHELLRAYQVAGGSVSHEPVGWKLLRVDEALGIQRNGETFSGSRPSYRRGDKAMEHIYCQL